ncbi:MAG: hypothetical protein OET55_05410 [Desulfuromonadales bacterium]|nr:hypothetical protein [Desulfuromonadales bacterium]
MRTTRWSAAIPRADDVTFFTFSQTAWAPRSPTIAIITTIKRTVDAIMLISRFEFYLAVTGQI